MNQKSAESFCQTLYRSKCFFFSLNYPDCDLSLSGFNEMVLVSALLRRGKISEQQAWGETLSFFPRAKHSCSCMKLSQNLEIRDGSRKVGREGVFFSSVFPIFERHLMTE